MATTSTADRRRLLRTAPPRPLVAASILSADFARMADECRDVLERGADLLHVDVMDGHFVSNLTMGPDMCRALRQHFPDVYLDVHLMVERPDLFVQPFAQAGADLLSFHAEVCLPVHPAGLDARDVIARVRSAGLDVGMVLNPYTSAQVLEPHLGNVDLVLVMSVVPGRSGQSFMPQVLDKVRWLKQRIGSATRLEMDGGISPATAPQAAEAGADVLVTASALFGARDRTLVVNQLHHSRPRNSVDAATHGG
jgi:ribulose-phosphate 3-epimerase